MSERLPTTAGAAALERFRTLLRIPTVSRADPADTDWTAFDDFQATVAELYPLLHEALELEVIAGHSLLYRWAGRDSGDPTVLMAHYDVVPASDDGWTHPPFAATLVGDGVDQQLWGRGTLDDKGALVSVLEAVERLAAEGFRPARDLYLSFGHNEETAGDGAASVVEALAARGVRPALVIDEGGAIADGVFPGVTAPVAYVGVSEKGLANLRLSVEQTGGHASTPPRLTATARLARAVVRLGARPFPARMSPTTQQMITTLGGHAHGPLGMVFRAARVTRPLLLAVFTRLSDETRALVRTTHAVTELSGSAAANVLAERATATVNLRIAVGSSVADAASHVRRAIHDDGVTIEVLEATEPSPVSPTTGAAWELLSEIITAIYPGTVVAPYIQLGASDSRRFTAICDHVYRFSPFRMSADERATLHARNERIHVGTWLSGIDFYEALIRRR